MAWLNLLAYLATQAGGGGARIIEGTAARGCRRDSLTRSVLGRPKWPGVLIEDQSIWRELGAAPPAAPVAKLKRFAMPQNTGLTALFSSQTSGLTAGIGPGSQRHAAYLARGPRPWPPATTRVGPNCSARGGGTRDPPCRAPAPPPIATVGHHDRISQGLLAR